MGHPAHTIDSAADSIKIYSGVHSLISDRLFSIQVGAATTARSRGRTTDRGDCLA